MPVYSPASEIQMARKLFVVDALPRNALDKVIRMDVHNSAPTEIETES